MYLTISYIIVIISKKFYRLMVLLTVGKRGNCFKNVLFCNIIHAQCTYLLSVTVFYLDMYFVLKVLLL